MNGHVLSIFGCRPVPAIVGQDRCLLLCRVSGALSTTTIVDMDPASQVLAQELPPGVRRTYTVLLERGKVPLSMVYYRDKGRRLKEALA